MHKVLFVCLGNICRSPMAEFVMKDMVKKAGREDEFEIASVAVSARQITERDLEHFDHIYYMDASNERYLRRLFGDRAEKCRRLLEHDVADPWYCGNFDVTYADVAEGCRRILEELT